MRSNAIPGSSVRCDAPLACRPRRRRPRGLLAIVLPCALHAIALHAADFTVSSPGDAHDAAPDGVCETAPANGVCTLRAAFEEADQRTGLFTSIEISPVVALVSLTLGPIAVDESVVLLGQGAAATTVAGSLGSRFLSQSAGQLILRRLKIAGFGEPDGGGGAVLVAGGSLLVEDCAFEGNYADAYGGAIHFAGADAELEIVRTWFSGNEALLCGGAVAVSAGTYTISRSIFEGGTAGHCGGALWATIPGSVESSFFADNDADLGGAIFIIAPGRLLNSTLHGNRSLDHGGALYYVDEGALPNGPFQVLNSTITDNQSNSNQGFDGGQGGGIYVGASSTLTLSNSILDQNFEWVSDGVCCFEPYYLECRGSISSNGYNIVGALDANCTVAGGTSGADPLLLPPAYHGGFSRTRALPAGSPAIGAGHPSGCVDDLASLVTTDQRGALRPAGGTCDLGAFEYGALIFDDGFEPFGTGRWSVTSPP